MHIEFMGILLFFLISPNSPLLSLFSLSLYCYNTQVVVLYKVSSIDLYLIRMD